MTCTEEGKDWDVVLSEVQNMINSSESKVNNRTPFETLHGYRSRFHQGALRELSKTADEWEQSEKLRETVREQMMKKKEKDKEKYDLRRYDNTHYKAGEIVVMKRVPTSTGESTKMQDRYRGPLVVVEVLRLAMCIALLSSIKAKIVGSPRPHMCLS